MSKIERISAAHRDRHDRLYMEKRWPRGFGTSYRIKGRQMPKGFSVGIIGFMVRYKGIV